MLLRDAMAIKFAKTVVSTVVKDSKDNTLKDNVTKALEQAYQTGYDLATELCDKDNSKYGFIMADMLRTEEEESSNG